MKLRLLCAAAVALPLTLISTAGIAAPILSTPVYYVAPGGNFESGSGDPTTQGRVITYSSFNNSAYADLYYAFGDAGPIGTWDTFLTDGPSLYAGNTTTEMKNFLTYNSSLSNLSSGLVIWEGTATTYSKGANLNTRFKMEITDTSNNPLSLINPTTLGLDASLGGVLEVTGNFKMTLNVLIQNPDASFVYNDGTGDVTCNTNDWCHSQEVWDELSNTYKDNTDQLYTSYDYAFYYNPVPIPAAVWLFGSGLLGLVGIARRKKA